MSATELAKDHISLQASPASPPGSPFDVGERIELALATYKALDMSPDDGAIREIITPGMQSYHDALVADGYGEEDRESIEVFQSYVLPEAESALGALLTAYDRLRQAKEGPLVVEAWAGYSSSQLNQRHLTTAGRSHEEPVPSGFGEVLGMELATHHYGEPGLQISEYRTEHKQEKAKAKIEDYDSSHQNTRLLLANPVDYIILSAQRAIQGAEPLDFYRTDTHFVQLPVQHIKLGKILWIQMRDVTFPASASHDYINGRLRLDQWRDDGAGTKTGVRFLVGT